MGNFGQHLRTPKPFKPPTMTDIKPYLKYCIGQKATFKAQHVDFTLDDIINYYYLATFSESDNVLIIPHLRKMESLTEMEQQTLYLLEFGSNPKQVIKQDIAENGLMIYEDANGSVRTIWLDSLSPAQFHYLTEIGIAWWATPEMWEKGLIIEVKS